MTKMCGDSVRHLSIWITFDIRASSFLVDMIDEVARGQRAPIFFVGFRHGFLLSGGNGLVYLRDGVFAPFGQCVPIQKVGFDNGLLRELQTIPRKRLLLHFVGHVARVIVFAVTGKSQHGGNDQLWRTPCTRAFDRTANYIQARGKIGPVQIITFESVSNRTFHQIIARKFAVVRR
jgi:hypothetical protein